MMLPPLLIKYIIRIEKKINKSNLKTFYKICIKVFREEKEYKISFSNKTDWIIQHFKKCFHFLAKTNEEQVVIFELLQNKANTNNNTVLSLILSKRSYKYILIFYIYIITILKNFLLYLF